MGYGMGKWFFIQNLLVVLMISDIFPNLAEINMFSLPVQYLNKLILPYAYIREFTLRIRCIVCSFIVHMTVVLCTVVKNLPGHFFSLFCRF